MAMVESAHPAGAGAPEWQQRLLIIIPAYNEEMRIGATLEAYVAHFRHAGWPHFAILVVLNGCRDRTRDVVERVAVDRPEIGLVEFPAPIGKGGAIRAGFDRIEEAELIGFVDADMATPPEAFHQLLPPLREYDAVIASRWLPESRVECQPFRRRLASRVFHAIVWALLGLPFRDTQCGAKVLRREALLAVRRELFIADMAFDVNLLFLLRRAGFRILEHPTTWIDRRGSKVRLLRTSLAMFLSVVRLRLIYSPLRPLYDRNQGLFRRVHDWLVGSRG